MLLMCKILHGLGHSLCKSRGIHHIKRLYSSFFYKESELWWFPKGISFLQRCKKDVFLGSSRGVIWSSTPGFELPKGLPQLHFWQVDASRSYIYHIYSREIWDFYTFWLGNLGWWIASTSITSWHLGIQTQTIQHGGAIWDNLRLPTGSLHFLTASGFYV